MATETPTPGRRATRNAPPLVFVSTALALFALVLPNALRIPQQDPTPVLEFAPIPPQDEEPPADPGNLSTLALGSSDTLAEPFDVVPELPRGEGDRPPGKQCFRDPVTGELRQSADPMAPPCVPYFDSDNGGETWRGVSGEEIRVIVYVDRGTYSDEPMYPAGFYEIDEIPPQPCPKQTNGDPRMCSQVMVRTIRVLAHYFNEHFMTYGRTARFFLHVADTSPSAVSRRVDASQQVTEIEPFAVIDLAVFGGHNEEYVDAASSRQVMVFSSQIATHRNAFYRRNAPYAWGFWPDVERWARSYVSYICQKVAPHPVAHSGGPSGVGNMNGRERVFGFFYTTDAREPGLRLFKELVEQGLRSECGVEAAAEGTFPESRFVVNNRDAGTSQADAVAAFRSADVTTVLYLGGIEGKFSQQAAAQAYYPEIVIAGDGFNDNTSNALLQNREVWRNAWAVSYQIREDRQRERFGYQAARQAQPTIDDDAAGWAAEFYRDFFMLYQGIQVAGPDLTPHTVEQGFHAIPERASDNPYVAACFFESNDYTCVKDAMEIWWDPNAQREGSNNPGCWRMVRGGHRYLSWRWEGGDDVFQDRGSAPCHGRGGGYRSRYA